MVPDIYNSLAEKMNFTYTLQKSRDGSWGSVDQVSDGLGTFHDFILHYLYNMFSFNFAPTMYFPLILLQLINFKRMEPGMEE
jgi:hypothetical protein